MRMRIAVITTSFNRKEKTVKAFNHLQSYRKAELEFFLCDDKSTDGTVEAVKNIIPEINIIEGTGNLFWSRGMQRAMEAAQKKDFDMYLMINDDVDFFDDAIDIMLESYDRAHMHCGIVGATLDENKQITTYSGKRINHSDFISPDGDIQECDLANWNCFLIDREVINKVGLIDDVYEHAHGDYDYSLMMKRKNYPIFVSIDYVGICARNSKKNTYMDHTLSRTRRIMLLNSKRGMPFKSGIYYCWKNYRSLGLNGYKSFLGTYIKNVYKILAKQDC